MKIDAREFTLFALLAHPISEKDYRASEKRNRELRSIIVLLELSVVAFERKIFADFRPMGKRIANRPCREKVRQDSHASRTMLSHG